MGDTNMNRTVTEDEHDETMRAYDALYGNLSPHHEAEVNQGVGGSIEDPDCAVDVAATEQFRARFGDETYYQPFTPRPPRGSVEDIQIRLRVNGW